MDTLEALKAAPKPLAVLTGSDTTFLCSMVTRSADLESQHSRPGRLGDVVGHEATDVELLHGGEVKTIERATVEIAGAPMLE